MRVPILLGAIAIVAAPVAAQDHADVEQRYSPEYSVCMRTGDAARGVTAGMMDCLGDEITRQDQRLNRQYRGTMAGLEPAQRSVLRAAERRWITDRDRQCQQSANESGGSLAAILYSSCILDQTIRRTMWLERYRP